MPNNPRQQIKADMDRVINHVQWIQEILIHTGEKYTQHHPEIRDQYMVAYAFFEQGKELIHGLRNAY